VISSAVQARARSDALEVLAVDRVFHDESPGAELIKVAASAFSKTMIRVVADDKAVFDGGIGTCLRFLFCHSLSQIGAAQASPEFEGLLALVEDQERSAKRQMKQRHETTASHP
jgi:hypothetical protein